MSTAIQPDVVGDGSAADPDDIPRSGRPGGTTPRHTTVRIACHLAAELPFVILCVRSMAAGWRPTSDDAVAAWRAWDVLSAHPTLVGAPTHTTGLGHQAFAPGPALSWLLAVPVHLDPTQGALWGSTLTALGAIVLAVEAGWAAAGRWGAWGASAAALTLATTETAVLMNPPWTPWQGALWLVAALACGWATAAGRWRWWPACVVAASIAAQAHVVFALTAIAVCVTSPLVAWATAVGRRRSGGGSGHDPTAARRCRPPTRPLVIGVLVGVALWLPPLIDEVAGRPGNLTLLWRSSHAPGARFGSADALQGLGAATWPPFSWAQRLPTTGADKFFSIVGTTFHGPSWHVEATVLALVALGTWAVVSGRRTLAGLASVATVASIACVITIAQTPRADTFELIYLGVLFWPVGLTVTGALGAGTTALVRTALGARLPAAVLRRIGDGAVVVALTALIALSVGVTVVDGRAVPNTLSVQGGPAIGVLADRGADAAARVAPDGPFELHLAGPAPVGRSSAVYPAIAYDLVTRGLQVRLPFAFAVGVDAGRTASGDLPVVTVHIATRHPTATVTPAG